MSLKLLFLKPFLKLMAVVFALLTSLGAIIGFSGASTSQGDDLRVSNKTRALEIVNIKREGLEVQLSLRNSYDKTVTAFEIAVPRFWANGIAEDRFPAFDEILPGETYETTVTLPSQQFKSSKSAQPESDIILLAVLFKDRTGDGDLEVAGKLEARRLGERAQIARIVPLLQKALELPDADLLAALQDLKDQVSASSRDVEATGAMKILRSNYADVYNRLQDVFTGEVASGLYFGREGFLIKIRDLERQLSLNRGLDLRNGLISIIKDYERKLAIL